MSHNTGHLVTTDGRNTFGRLPFGGVGRAQLEKYLLHTQKDRVGSTHLKSWVASSLRQRQEDHWGSLGSQFS